jgi:hypothetical protein
MRSHSHSVLFIQDKADQKAGSSEAALHHAEPELSDIASLTSDADLALRMYFLLGTPPRASEPASKKRKSNSASRIDTNPTQKSGSGFFGILESLRR